MIVQARVYFREHRLHFAFVLHVVNTVKTSYVALCARFFCVTLECSCNLLVPKWWQRSSQFIPQQCLLIPSHVRDPHFTAFGRQKNQWPARRVKLLRNQ